MRAAILLAFSVAAMVPSSVGATAQKCLSRGCTQASAAPATTIMYGADSRQGIDLYVPDRGIEAAPLVVFIHGGGWSFGDRGGVERKASHFARHNLAFASAGYRVLPDAPVETQAEDLAMAISALRGEAPRWGYDADRIVLMGHSAGAHLAALLATQDNLLGEDMEAIRGVILLDGAAYDIPAQMAGPGRQIQRIYQRVLGTDPQRQRALSPIHHVGGADAPHWLALYVSGRKASKAQSEMFMAKLAQTGARASAIAIPDTDHRHINRNTGIPGDPATAAIDAFLARVF